MHETSLDMSRKSPGTSSRSRRLNPITYSEFSVNGVFEHLGIGPSCNSFMTSEDSQLAFLQIRLLTKEIQPGQMVSGVIWMDSAKTPKKIQIELRGQYNVKTTRIAEAASSRDYREKLKKKSTFQRNPFQNGSERNEEEKSSFREPQRISLNARRYSSNQTPVMIHTTTSAKQTSTRQPLTSFGKEVEVCPAIIGPKISNSQKKSSSPPMFLQVNSPINQDSMSSESFESQCYEEPMNQDSCNEQNKRLVFTNMSSINEQNKDSLMSSGFKEEIITPRFISSRRLNGSDDDELDYPEFDYKDEDIQDTDDGPILTSSSDGGGGGTKINSVVVGSQRKKFINSSMKVYNMPMGWNVFLVKNWKIFEFCKGVIKGKKPYPVLLFPFSIRLPEELPPTIMISVPDDEVIHTFELTYEVHAVGFYPKQLNSSVKGITVERCWDHLEVEKKTMKPKEKEKSGFVQVQKPGGFFCCASQKNYQVRGKLNKDVLIKNHDASEISLSIEIDSEILEDSQYPMVSIIIFEIVEWKSISFSSKMPIFSKRTQSAREFSYFISSKDLLACLSDFKTPELSISHQIAVSLVNTMEETREVLQLPVVIDSQKPLVSMNPNSRNLTSFMDVNWVKMPFSKLK